MPSGDDEKVGMILREMRRLIEESRKLAEKNAEITARFKLLQDELEKAKKGKT